MHLSLKITPILLIIAQSAFAQNVMISNVGNPSEPSIMMDPTNTDVLVAGSNLDYVYTSDDGGKTWETKKLTSPFGVWGDPVIDIDTAGDFYFFHLSNTPGGTWIDRIVCQKSTDDGQTWSTGTFTGLNGTKQQDKQWSVVDRKNNNIYMTWTQFDKYEGKDPLDSSTILFSKSVDGGANWSTAKRINFYAGDCIDKDNTVEGATPAVGANGEVYVAWTGPKGLVFNRSLDQGETWLKKEIFVDSMPGGWDYDIPGLGRCNGLPVVKCDLSGGANHGTIYINWSDQRNGTNNTDIWLTKSVDGGNTWAKPKKVNNEDSKRHQFLTWMDIDQTNGNLHFVFYDRRNYTDNQTDVYLAASENAGVSFTNTRISESPFVPHPGIFFGDYTNIVAHNNVVRPIWTRLNQGVLSIWTDITPLDKMVSVKQVNTENLGISQFPNPTSIISYVSFKLHESSDVNLELFDAKGASIHHILVHQKMDYGKYVIPVNVMELHLSSGMYYFNLTINGISKTIKTWVK